VYQIAPEYMLLNVGVWGVPGGHRVPSRLVSEKQQKTQKRDGLAGSQCRR
jgi:hypothetical protein